MPHQKEYLDGSALLHENEYIPDSKDIIIIAAGVDGDVSSSVELARTLVGLGMRVELHLTEDNLTDAIKLATAAGVVVHQDLGPSVAQFVSDNAEYSTESATKQMDTSTGLTTTINSGLNRILAPYYELPPQQRPYLLVNSLPATFSYHALIALWNAPEKLFVVDAGTVVPIWGEERIHGSLVKEAGNILSGAVGEKVADAIMAIASPVAKFVTNNEQRERQVAAWSHATVRKEMQKRQGPALIESHQRDIAELGIDTTYIDLDRLQGNWDDYMLEFRAAFLTSGNEAPYKVDGERYILPSIAMSGFEIEPQEQTLQDLFREQVLNEDKLFAMASCGSWGFNNQEWVTYLLGETVRDLDINLLVINSSNLKPEAVESVRVALPNNVFLTNGKINFVDWMPLVDYFILHGGRATTVSAHQLSHGALLSVIGGDQEQRNTWRGVWDQEDIIGVHNRKLLLPEQEDKPGTTLKTQVRKDLARVLAHPRMERAKRYQLRREVSQHQAETVAIAWHANEQALGIMAASIIRAIAVDERS
jgi:hypothetical protein